jgi:hypothetical protein
VIHARPTPLRTNAEAISGGIIGPRMPGIFRRSRAAELPRGTSYALAPIDSEAGTADIGAMRREGLFPKRFAMGDDSAMPSVGCAFRHKAWPKTDSHPS